ncbi:MAG TPA: protein-L-isoaspartate(D-aspartate) O-methyltransferase [Solirubrobacterales bacterium]|jgi:protein-L-isoaspartate(D-aspartate) O-methyltransferase|nr:protein-L-isoaspartate(D-aspartate) O-methyltransferase [Solirubrobacterales bacterium]
MSDFRPARRRMVERQLRARGIEDERVLTAMGEVPREAFLPEALRERAYADSALPIGEEQTISQPWIVAAICQALELDGSELVLEVGTGSGYSAGVLARLAAHVVSVERHPQLSEAAAEVLGSLGVGNVEIVVGDGSLGVAARAPFDAIAVHAAAPTAPSALIDQLAEGGRLVVPVSGKEADVLTVLRRVGGRVETTELGPCRFVPLIGEEGFGG